MKILIKKIKAVGAGGKGKAKAGAAKAAGADAAAELEDDADATGNKIIKKLIQKFTKKKLFQLQNLKLKEKLERKRQPRPLMMKRLKLILQVLKILRFLKFLN